VIILTLRAIRQARDPETARRVIADALPPELASILPMEQLELMRQKLQQFPEPRARPRLTKRDWIGALGLCLLSFLATFPVVIPFIFLSDAKLALRVSYAVAIVMLFCCGCAFGYHSGLRPWAVRRTELLRKGAELSAGGDRRQVVEIHADDVLALLLAVTDHGRLAAFDIGAVAGGVRHVHHLEADQRLVDFERLRNLFQQRLAVRAIGDVEIFARGEPMGAGNEGRRAGWGRVLPENVFPFSW
jgi:hypothetical protein